MVRRTTALRRAPVRLSPRSYAATLRPVHDPEFAEFLSRLKQLVSIDELARERVAGLRRTGALWEACCPFHQERTPSFKVDPRRGTWRCYGACGEGGDAISLVQKLDGLGFLEAVEQLANRTGLEVPARAHRSGAADDRLAPLHDCLERAATLYEKCLRGPEGRAALAYARRRGLVDATLEAFGVGFATEGRLLAHAREVGLAPETLLACGLARRADDGRVFEFFRGRLMIPIRDKKGRTVGFGARVLDGGEPKYLNSPESDVFHKGRLMYGFDRAIPEIRRSKRIVLVEGYTDVMAAHQAGAAGAVAVLGTAFTDDHAALIRQSGARRATLFFDGDTAGRKAVEKALAGLLPLDLTIDVAAPPEGRDPGDLCSEAGAAELRALLDQPRDWFEFSVAGIGALPPKELSDAVNRILALLARIAEPVHRSARMRELARAAGLPFEDVRDQWAAQERFHRPLRPAASGGARSAPPHPPGGAPAGKPSQGPLAGVRPGPGRSYRNLVGALLVDNSLISIYEPDCAACVDPELAGVLAALLELHRDAPDGAHIGAAALMDRLGDHPLRSQIPGWEEDARNGCSAADLARGEIMSLRDWQARKLGERLADDDPYEVLRAVRESKLQGRFTAATKTQR